MLDIFLERLRQKKRTVAFPASVPTLPPRFRGRPRLDAATCAGARGEECGLCAAACPVGAIRMENTAGVPVPQPETVKSAAIPAAVPVPVPAPMPALVPALDMGVCTFCGACAAACPEKALNFTNDWRLGSTEREALIVRPSIAPPPPPPVRPCGEQAFTRSFRLRQVSAAGCGACEADLNVLTTVVFDLGRFGMDFVASPRHADGLILTGPLPRNMREATQKCLNAMARPKKVIAVGACAISGGLFRPLPGEPSEPGAEGASPHLTPDLYIPGCPPHPYTSLDALLRFIGLAVPGE